MIIASLGVMIHDVLQYLLLYGRGLPLPLAGTRFSFTDIIFFLSPSFRSGIRGLKPKSMQTCFVAFTVSCGLLAAFIGPASALLLIPAVRDDWPAGGTIFWLNGNMSSLWPIELNSSHTGPPQCQNPLATYIFNQVGQDEYMPCIWQSTKILSQSIFTPDVNSTVSDYGYPRTISRSTGAATWSVTSMAYVTAAAANLHSDWSKACSYVGKKWTRLNSFTRYSKRDRLRTTYTVNSTIPAVRVACHSSGETSFSESKDLLVRDYLLPTLTGILMSHSFLFYRNS